MASATRPKWIDDPIAAAIGRIVMLEERVAECERQREQIARQESRIRFLEEQLANLQRQPEVLTAKEAAKALGVSDKTLWNYKQAGLIEFIDHPGSRIAYRREHIERFLERYERGKKGSGK